jgi:alpha-1,6-mannosyltransferase
MCFIFLYSFLAHKELRFIYPILPLLNCFAALGLQKLLAARDAAWNAGFKQAKEEGASSKNKNAKTSTTGFTVVGALVRLVQLALAASFLVSLLSLYISSWNYPGGEALRRFHLLTARGCAERVRGDELPKLHVSNLAATTGASRFAQHEECVRYSKTERLANLDEEDFDFLVSEHAQLDEYAPLTKNIADGVDLSVVEAFKGLYYNLRRTPMIEIDLKPTLYLKVRNVPWVNKTALALQESDRPGPTIDA